MPPIYTDDCIHTGIHDFKTNIAKYIRAMDSGQYNHLILMRRGTPIGGFFTFKGRQIQEQQQKQEEQRARKEELSGLLNGPDSPLTGLLSGLLGPDGQS